MAEKLKIRNISTIRYQPLVLVLVNSIYRHIIALKNKNRALPVLLYVSDPLAEQSRFTCGTGSKTIPLQLQTLCQTGCRLSL